MNTNFQTIHQMGNAVSEMVRQATGRNSVQSMDMDWVTVEQVKKWIYGEDSGDIVSFVTNLRNGITQLRASIMPVQDLHGFDNPWPGGGGKNILPCLLSSIKSNNTTGTWNNDDYSINGITFKFTVNAEGYVTSIKVSGTATDNATVRIYSDSTGLPADNYIVNGCPEEGGSGLYYIRLYNVNGTSGGTAMYDYGSGITIEDTYTIKRVNVTVENGNTVSNLYFYPMARKASVTDDSFVPYTNICPITGWNMCNVFVTGRNLLNPDDFREGYYVNTSGVLEEFQYASISGYIPAKSGSVYRFSGYAHSTTGGYRSVTAYDSEGNFIKQWRYSELVSADTKYEIVVRITDPNIKILLVNFQNVDYDIQVAISSSNISYEEFTGNTYTAIWSDEDPGVVYYGTLDVITGILTVEWESRTIGDLTWSRTEENGVVSYRHNETSKKVGYSNIICSHYRTGRSGDSGEFTITGRSANRNIYIVDSRFNSTDDWLADVGTGTYIFQLATPRTYQLDPNTVESITGINYIMADTGTVSVEYRHEEEMP